MVYDFTNPIYILLMILLFRCAHRDPGDLRPRTAVLPLVLIWRVS